MVTFTQNAAQVFRDYVTDGVPASGKYSPVKAEIRTLIGELQKIAPGAVTPEFVTPSWPGGDATTLLQAWIQYGIDHAVPLSLAGAYTVSGRLTISGPVTIAGLGGGGSQITNTANTDLLYASGVDGIAISGLSLVGNRGVGVDGFYSAIAMYNCDDLVIVNNRIKSFKGAGTFITSGCLRSLISQNMISLCQFGTSVFKGCKHSVITSNIYSDIDTDGIFIDDATQGDTAGTAAANECCVVDGNMLTRCAITGVGYGIAVSGLKAGVISNNLIDDGGVSGSIVCVGIVVNSGQDDFNISRDVAVVGNTVRGMKGGGAIQVAGAIDCIIANNICHDNFQWSSVLNNASEISIANAATLTTQRIQVFGNVIRKDTGESDIGITVGASTAEIAIGANTISGVAEYQINSAAGVVRWTAVANGTLPAHQAGFRGRIWVDDSGVAWAASGSAWVKIGTQT